MEAGEKPYPHIHRGQKVKSDNQWTHFPGWYVTALWHVSLVSAGLGSCAQCYTYVLVHGSCTDFSFIFSTSTIECTEYLRWDIYCSLSFSRTEDQTSKVTGTYYSGSSWSWHNQEIHFGLWYQLVLARVCANLMSEYLVKSILLLCFCRNFLPSSISILDSVQWTIKYNWESSRVPPHDLPFTKRTHNISFGLKYPR